MLATLIQYLAYAALPALAIYAPPLAVAVVCLAAVVFCEHLPYPEVPLIARVASLVASLGFVIEQGALWVTLPVLAALICTEMHNGDLEVSREH